MGHDGILKFRLNLSLHQIVSLCGGVDAQYIRGLYCPGVEIAMSLVR